jgi:uncharacterized protein with GYD domain
MPKYLAQGNYSAEGARGLVKEGAAGRRAAVEKLVKSMGGTIECMYYAFGDTDVFVVVDMPDNVSVCALAAAINMSGAVSLRTTVLLSVEEVDMATKKLPSYRPPGQ